MLCTVTPRFDDRSAVDVFCSAETALSAAAVVDMMMTVCTLTLAAVTVTRTLVAFGKRLSMFC